MCYCVTKNYINRQCFKNLQRSKWKNKIKIYAWKTVIEWTDNKNGTEKENVLWNIVFHAEKVLRHCK